MMTEKTGNSSGLKSGELTPLLPDAVLKQMEDQFLNGLGYDNEDFTVSLEFGVEDSGAFRKALSLVENNDTRQKITRRGIECYYITYNLPQFLEMLTLYETISSMKYHEAYINHKRLPYIHSLWIPLISLIVDK